MFKPSVCLLLLLSFLGLAPTPALATEHADGVWLALSGGGDLGESGRLRWDLQGQARYLDQLEGVRSVSLRPGLRWRLDESWSLAGGYAWYRTEAEGLPGANEHRIWEQLDWRGTRANGDLLKSRTRLEQRFQDGRDGTAWWLRQALALEPAALRSGRYQGLFGAEVFLELNDTDWTDPGYSQGRLMGGIRTAHGDLDIEFLYLLQHNQRDGRTDLLNHWLRVNFLR